MVRATVARVLIRLGGTYVAGFDAINIGNLCTSAYYILDGYTNPEVLSTSDDKVIEIEVDIVLSLMAEILWYQAGGYNSGKPKPEILTPEIRHRIEQLMAENYSYIQTIDTVEDSG